MSCWWIVTVCCETLMFTLTDIFEGQSCLFGWTSSGVWLPGLTSAFYEIQNWRICLKSSLHHSTSLIVQVGPSEVLRPSSYWTVDARVSLQWQRSHLELREPAARQVVWGGRAFLGSIFPLAGVRSSFSHFQVCDLPVRAAVFVPRKNWVVTGSDDMQVGNIFTSLFWLIPTS